MKNLHSLFRKTVLFLAVTGLLLILASWNVRVASATTLRADEDAPSAAAVVAVQASSPTPTPQPTSAPVQTGPSPHTSGDCLGCHGNEKMVGKFPNGETVSLYVVPLEQADSFHTQKGVGCGFCHQDQKTYPHKDTASQACSICHYQISGNAPQGDQLVFDLPYEDARALSLSLSTACRQCHSNKFDEAEDSAHTRLQKEGNRYAPVCVDCHSGHRISNVNRLMIAKVCSQCHRAEYFAYKSSVHGAALEKESNFDMPTCSDCHGNHKVVGPSDSDFRGKAATEMCGKCHADQALMRKYGLSTEVLSTYLDDVHAQTDLLGRLDNSSYTKATCYDCHGTHNILSPKNPYSKVYPDNLQKTCQQCHKDANISFPQTWLSHKTPSSTNLSGLSFINRFSLAVVAIAVVVIVFFMIFDDRRRMAGKSIIHIKRDE
jgi:hypothetical protein